MSKKSFIYINYHKLKKEHTALKSRYSKDTERLRKHFIKEVEYRNEVLQRCNDLQKQVNYYYEVAKNASISVILLLLVIVVMLVW